MVYARHTTIQGARSRILHSLHPGSGFLVIFPSLQCRRILSDRERALNNPSLSPPQRLLLVNNRERETGAQWFARFFLSLQSRRVCKRPLRRRENPSYGYKAPPWIRKQEEGWDESKRSPREGAPGLERKEPLFCAHSNFRPAKKRKMPRTGKKAYGNAYYLGYMHFQFISFQHSITQKQSMSLNLTIL